VPTERVHSHYQRTLADLPWGDWSVRLGVTVRKLFCDNPHCGRRVFTERLPDVVAPWARKTVRLCQRLTAIAAALGGAAGSRLTHTLGMPAARNTLLRLIRAASLPPSPAPAVLGVDDWAYRKGHTYGTVLVDLERRRPIALWEGRDADALAQWLREHPDVEVVARDRASAYAEGVRRGAPQAVQVADRFHLLQNLAETLQSALSTHAAQLPAAEEPAEPATGQTQMVRPAPRRKATNRPGARPRRVGTGGWLSTSRFGRYIARAGPKFTSPATLVSVTASCRATSGTNAFRSGKAAVMRATAGCWIPGSRSF
jgi:transposase